MACPKYASKAMGFQGEIARIRPELLDLEFLLVLEEHVVHRPVMTLLPAHT